MAGTKRKSNSTCSNSKRKNNAAKQLELDDEMSTDTAQASNTAPTTHHYATFLLSRTEVKPSKKGTDTMRKKFASILSTLQEVDSTVAFSPFKTNNEDSHTPVNAQ